jgi:hypothetical protein
MVQVRGWGLVVAQPDEIYDRQYKALLDATLEKIRQVEAGGEPEVAATLEEMGVTGSTGEVHDGGA